MQKLPVALALSLAACAHAPLITRADALAALPPEAIGDFDRSRLEGKVVLVVFISTWCFPCLVDMPVLTRLQKDHPDTLAVLLVGMDLDGRKVLDPFATTNALQLPLFIADEQLLSGQTAFGRVSELPTRYVFRRDGSLAFAYSGVAEPKDLIEAIERELR